MKKYIIIGITIILLGVSIFLLDGVVVNYDMKKYLPDDHELTEGINLHDELYGTSSFTHLIVRGETLGEALKIKQEIAALDHVVEVDFIDNILNEITYGIFLSNVDENTQNALNQSMGMMMGQGLSFTESFYQIIKGSPEVLVSQIQSQIDLYEQNNLFKMTISMDVESSSMVVESIVANIKDVLDEHQTNATLVGGVMSDLFVRDSIEGEVLKITLILIPLVLIILLLMTPSFADILVFIIISGVAIVINLGTNALFADISFITQSMAIALQLAISLDYIIFIVHRYHKDREDKTKDDAMKSTMKHVSSPVIASALTTGVSFLALVFMRFSIGTDIGLVFLKAVVLSALSALILGPIIIKMLDSWIEKSKHRVFIPRFSSFSKFVYKFRFVLLVVFALIVVPAYYFQSHNSFIYGESSMVGTETANNNGMNEMVEAFGFDNQMVIITNRDQMKEGMLYQELMIHEELKINSIQSMVYYQSMITDPNILAFLEQNFYKNGYQRMIVSLDLPEEDETSEAALKTIQDILISIGFDETYIIGTTPAALAIKDVTETDYFYVTLIAIVLIMAVILFAFKNWILPIILPLVIITSVFLTMSIPYFAGYSLSFLGYLVVSTILLGATIDYAILFSKSYIKLRETYDVHNSIEHAIEDSAPSITTSALIFGVAGLSVSLISSVLAIKQIGLQIALGALFGLISVLVLLPQLIFIFDKLITRSKVKTKS